MVDGCTRLLPKMTANGDKFDFFLGNSDQKGTKYEVAYQLYQSGGADKYLQHPRGRYQLGDGIRKPVWELIKSKGIDRVRLRL